MGPLNWLNPSGRHISLRSIQPVTKMSVRINTWDVRVAGVGYQYPPIFKKI